MTDDREPFREARAAGLQKRHEQRLENATYTAAEVKVLTEAALRLGRKEAGEEIAAALQEVPALWMANSSSFDDGIGRRESVRLAREIASQPAPDATSGRTDPKVDSDLPPEPQAVRSPQERCGLADLDNRCIQFGEDA